MLECRTSNGLPVTRKLFIDQLPEAVVKTMPYLLHACVPTPSGPPPRRHCAVALNEEWRTVPPTAANLWIEVLHENLWRLLLDWPPVLGLPSQRRMHSSPGVRCPAQRRMPGRATQNLLARNAPPTRLKNASKNWPTASIYETHEVMRPPGAGCPMPGWLTGKGIVGHAMPLQSPSPSIRPRSPIVARLAEVETAVKALWPPAAPFPLAAAWQRRLGRRRRSLTARGVLTHAAHVVDGKVASYRVSGADRPAILPMPRPCHLCSP
jgi:hypothetical protein